MRILYINSAIYDFLNATLIEGLNALAREAKLEVIVTQQANYALPAQVWRRERILRYGKSFDLILLGTNIGADAQLCFALDRRERSVCVDGEDSETLTHPCNDFRLYFKRELLGARANDRLLPCPFAIEQRWWQPLHRARKRFLAACFGPTTGARAELLDCLKSLALEPNGSHVGAVPLSRWDRYLGIWLGQCRWSVAQRHGFAVGHNRPYYQILGSSRLALAPPGAGYDTGRRWEILGSGSVLVLPTDELQVPEPFLPGEHCIEYSGPADLVAKLQWAHDHPQSVEAIAVRTRKHCQAYHTTKERARYVVRTYLESGPVGLNVDRTVLAALRRGS